MPKLVIKIADSGTIYRDPVKGDNPSLTGHMWWELHDSNGQVTSYGFSPKDGYEGMPIAPGSVKYNDSSRYDFSTAKGDYKSEFEITDAQLETLKRFGDKPNLKEFGFDMRYNGLSNSCINFTYKALDIIGFVPKGYDGDVWPTLNIDNIKALPSSNKSDTKIFISSNGGLFLLDDKKQMTIKLFSDANAIDNAKTNSLAINSAKLGSQKTLIKDVNNKKVAEFEVRKGDQTYIFNDSLLLKAEAKFLTKNGKEISQDNAIIKFSDDQLNKLTLIRTDLTTTLKDNTTSTLSSILNTIDSAQATLSHFMDSFLKESTSLFTTPEGIAGMISDISAGIQRGDSAEEIAAIIATKTALRTLASELQNKIIFSEADQAVIESGNLSDLFFLTKTSAKSSSIRVFQQLRLII